MARYETHKRGQEGRAQTIARRQARIAKGSYGETRRGAHARQAVAA